MSRRVTLNVWLVALATACGSTVAQELPNPFAQPTALRAEPRTGVAKPAEPVDLALRATLVRGRDSSANIGGRILRVGEKIGGYRLSSVREGAAVLVDASGVSYVLEVEPPRQVAP